MSLCTQSVNALRGLEKPKPAMCPQPPQEVAIAGFGLFRDGESSFAELGE
jgi:hypothetical protein